MIAVVVPHTRKREYSFWPNEGVANLCSVALVVAKKLTLPVVAAAASLRFLTTDNMRIAAPLGKKSEKAKARLDSRKMHPSFLYDVLAPQPS